jgi:hypothetical protein
MFYWVSVTNSPEVNNVSVVVGNINGHSYSAQSVFNVHEPTVTNTGVQTGTPGIDATTTHIGLYGIGGNPNIGVTFQAQVEVPAGFQPGEWNFTQTVTRRRLYTNSAGKAYHILNNGRPGLDKAFPYPAALGDPGWSGTGWPTGSMTHFTSDSPQQGFNSDDRAVSLSDLYIMTIMFRPSGDSRWVPVQRAAWSLDVSALNPQGSGMGLNAAWPPSVSARPFEKTQVVPVWDIVHKTSDPFVAD